MSKKSIGFIETWGLTACVAAADAAVKGGNVKLLGYEYAKGGGLCTIKVEGDVGACKAAIAAAKRAADSVKGSNSGTKSVLLKARPADGIMNTMVNNRETVGGEIALAEGYRPKGESRVPTLVKNWKPKTEEPKVEETVIEETPVSPVEEDLKEETEAEEDSDPESQEPAMEVVVEETEEEAEVESLVEEVPETVEAPAEVETAEVEAPESVIAEEVEAPETVETEVVVAPVEEVEVPETKEEAPAETSEKETPKKSTSTGNRRRSRRKKKTDE